MNIFRLISGFAKCEEGYHPTIKIKSNFSPGIVTFKNVTKNTDQEARSFAMMVIGKFEKYKKENLVTTREDELVREAMQFLRQFNKTSTSSPQK